MLAAADDPYCPGYPQAVRVEIADTIALDRDFANYSRVPHRGAAANRLSSSANFIDQLIAKNLTAGGVAPRLPPPTPSFSAASRSTSPAAFPPSTKPARTSPTPPPISACASSTKLLASPAYADQLRSFFINRFKVTRSHESISTPARNVFYDFVHELPWPKTGLTTTSSAS